MAAAAVETAAARRATEVARLGSGRDEQEQAGHAMEALFATMLVKEMRRGLPEGFFKGAGSDVFAAWFDEHIGRTLAARDTLGLSRLVNHAVGRAAAAEPPIPEVEA